VSDIGTVTNTAPVNLKSESRSDVGTSTAPVNITSDVGTLTSNAPPPVNLTFQYHIIASFLEIIEITDGTPPKAATVVAFMKSSPVLTACKLADEASPPASPVSPKTPSTTYEVRHSI
jgi:hypothetical protein